MDENKRVKPIFIKRSVSLRADQWMELEQFADEQRHGMVSRALQTAIDDWTSARERAANAETDALSLVS